MTFIYIFSFIYIVKNTKTPSNKHIIYRKFVLRMREDNGKLLEKVKPNYKSNTFAKEMSMQTKNYLKSCIINPKQNIDSLITQIVKKRNISPEFEKSILIFVSSSENMQMDKQNLCYKSLSWNKKLLRLILYFAYDFFFNIEIRIFANEENCKFYINMNKRITQMLQNEEYQIHMYTLIKNVYYFSSKAKITLRHIINIAKSDILCDEFPFKIILGFIINEIYKLIVCKIYCNEYNDTHMNNGKDQATFCVQLKKTLQNHPHYLVLWRDVSKPTCIASYSFAKISNVSSLTSTLRDISLILSSEKSLKSSNVIVFDVSIIKIIIMYIINVTHITLERDTALANYDETVELGMFMYLCCSQYCIKNLAESLCSLETKLIELTASYMNKTNKKHSYLFLYIVMINYDIDFNKLYKNMFNSHYNKFQKEYQYKKNLICQIEKFLLFFTKIIKNSLKSINENVCGYIEINESELHKTTDEDEGELPSYIFKQRNYVTPKPKSQKEFEFLILKDQENLYNDCFEKRKILFY